MLWVCARRPGTPLWHLDLRTLTGLLPIVVSHITVMQFLNKTISRSALPLFSFSEASAAPAYSHPGIGRGLLAGSALLFSPVPRWISACQAAERTKSFRCYGQWRRWQWMWKCADDSTPRGTSSEFRRGSFHQIPPHPTDSLRRVSRDVDGGISPRRWYEIMLSGALGTMCHKDRRHAVISKRR